MAQTSFGRSNFLASIFILLIPLGLSAFSFQKKFLGVSAIIILFVSLVLTQSRGGIISLAIGLIFWFILCASPGNMGRTVIFALGGIGFFAVIIAIINVVLPKELLDLFMRRFLFLQYQMISNLDSISRFDKIVTAWNYIIQKPFIGVGIGNQTVVYKGGSVHNLYLETFLETGFFSFIALSFILFGCGRALFNLRKYTSDTIDRMVVNGLIVLFIVALINAAEEPSFWAVQYSYVFWMLMAFGFAFRKIQANSAKVMSK